MSRVLIVEDAAVDRALALAVLGSEEDLEVETVSSGKEALESIGSDMPDVVVTDLIMPEMTGLDLLEEVKQRFPLLPVIVMTSKGSEEIAVSALQLGAASYVPKSTLASTLADTIESVLSSSVKRHGRASLMKVMVESHSSFVLENDRQLFRPLITYLQDTMSEFGLFDDMQRTRIGVAIEEALNNAAEHGNLELDSALRETDFKGYIEMMQKRCEEDEYRDRRVYVEARFSPSEVVFDIRDDGAGFDPQALPDPLATSADSISGRGLTLMRMFMDEVEFNDAGNQVRMTKRRPESP